MKKQAVPSASTCPYCGAEPEHDPTHVLSATGYTVDEITFSCSECFRSWTCGVPIGEIDGELAVDLFCESCEERYGFPHRVHRPTNEQNTWQVDLKCPACFYHWTVEREGGPMTMFFGYPHVTGSVDDAEPYSYH